MATAFAVPGIPGVLPRRPASTGSANGESGAHRGRLPPDPVPRAPERGGFDGSGPLVDVRHRSARVEIPEEGRPVSLGPSLGSDAELVVLRIAEHDQVLHVGLGVEPVGSQPNQPVDFCGDVADREIQVDTVLHRLRLGDALEP